LPFFFLVSLFLFGSLGHGTVNSFETDSFSELHALWFFLGRISYWMGINIPPYFLPFVECKRLPGHVLTDSCRGQRLVLNNFILIAIFHPGVQRLPSFCFDLLGFFWVAQHQLGMGNETSPQLLHPFFVFFEFFPLTLKRRDP